MLLQQMDDDMVSKESDTLNVQKKRLKLLLWTARNHISTTPTAIDGPQINIHPEWNFLSG